MFHLVEALLGLLEVKVVHGGVSPGQLRQPVQVALRPVELGAVLLQRRQLLQLLLDRLLRLLRDLLKITRERGGDRGGVGV